MGGQSSEILEKDARHAMNVIQKKKKSLYLQSYDAREKNDNRLLSHFVPYHTKAIHIKKSKSTFLLFIFLILFLFLHFYFLFLKGAMQQNGLTLLMPINLM